MTTPYVEKDIPVQFDLGNLAVADENSLVLGENVEEALASITRDNTQLLLNQILKLPAIRTVDGATSSSKQNSSMVLFQLPDTLWPLPREKALPKVKPPTKWEAFAAKKGIQAKAKDGKLVYDEETQKWVPKWGYGSIKNKLDNQWLVEVDDKADKEKGEDLIDPRKLRRDERKKLIKKNLAQQKKNAQRAGA